MSAFVILLLAAFSRFLPHLFHGTALNFTAVGAGLLFFGARRPRWQAGIAVAVMAATDFLLTHYVYNYPFAVRGYLITWVWYAAVCLIGSGLLQRVTALRVAAGVIASATSFFVVSNFMVWAGGEMYPRTLHGLAACYAAAVPFYANDLVSTGLIASALFGVPVLAERLVRLMQPARHAA